MNTKNIETKLKSLEEIFIINKNKKDIKLVEKNFDIDKNMIHEANSRLIRFSPYIKKVFPETSDTSGMIESNLRQIDNNFFIKEDSHLKISGSIKARGGIYSVLKYAEELALNNSLIGIDDDYSILANENFKKFFSNYTIIVGSTGNLGLSIGIISRALGFRVRVHMSRDAKIWKVNRLRNLGAEVILHSGDFTLAVSKARKESLDNKQSKFIDDENSKDLFLGYSVAAINLKNQIERYIPNYKNEDIYVYLPCGVGGGPSGIAYGMYHMIGENVKPIICEPVNAPSMAYGVLVSKCNHTHVEEIGININTIADGLAVGRASNLACNVLSALSYAFITKNDKSMLNILKDFYGKYKIKIEPSAAISLFGPKINNNKGIHISWLTGGSMMPDEEFKKYLL